VTRAAAAAAGRSAVPPLVPTQLARRLAFETLEPRLLMSADVPAVLFSDILASTPALQGAEFRAIAAPAHAPIVIAAAAPPDAADTPTAPRATELAIIDAAVPDHDRLIELLQADAASRGHALEVVLVAPGRDGIDAISAALAGRSGLDAVHVVAHGAAGEVRLGATRLDAAALAAEAGQVRAWGQALGPDGDLLLYGCEVASAVEGRALVDMLALLTAADVAASDDRTGHAALGGDWELEYVAGAVESAPGANTAMASWQGVLAATYYLGGDTSPPFSDLESAAPTDAVWDADNNYDPTRDAEPGRVIQKDNASASQSDATKHHTWTVAAPVGGLAIANEPVTLTLWTAMKDFAPGKSGTVTAYLLDLATATATSGTLIAQATIPSKPWGTSWREETLDFGLVTHTVAAGRHLGVKLVVGNASDDDLWFAYDATAYPSRLQIGAPNQAPVAADDAYAMTEDTVLAVAGKGVLANDTDVDSPVLSAVLVTGPARGTLALAADGSFTYTPAPDFFGVDSFTYLADDGAAVSSVATVTITVANAVDNTVVVNTTADAADGDTSSIDALLANRGSDGVVSLREAILAANATPNGGTPDRIHFDIPGAGPHVIGVLTTLPALSDAVVIDGTTEPGYAGAPLVQLDGGGGAGNGLRLAAGGSTVRGLAITGFGQAGILVSGAGNRIQGNYIGVDATGSAADANGQYGVRLMSGGNLVGGAAAGDRNVISGNLIDGVYVGGGSGNVVQGNYIGTDATGMMALPNREDGVWINGATDTLVTGNLLSGNAWSGVATTGSGAGTRILANLIGLDAPGTGTIANQRQGVLLGGFDAVQVGGTGAGEGNRIAGNLLDGVAVVAGTGHSILGNAIHDNGGLGIDLGDDGVTASGMPQIAYASTDGTVAGTLAAAPATTYRIELFASPGADPSGYGEGRRYLGHATVATDAAGNASFAASVAPFAAGEIITGTATDLASGATSEFGAGVAATPPNTLPVSADAAVTLDEDTARAFTVADFPFADADLGDTLGGVRIDTLPATGLLTLGGVAVTAGQFIAAADIAAGLLVYAPVAEASGVPYAAFTFAVRDSGAPPGFAAAARTMTLNVLAVNDSPVLGALEGDARAYAEGAALMPVDVGGDATVGDVDSPDFDGGALTVGIVSGGDAAEDVLAIRHQGFGAGQIGVSGATVSFGGVAIGSVSGGSGGADLVVALNGNATSPAVQALIRNVGYRNADLDAPTPGARSVRFVVSDGDGGASPAAVATITVGAVNDAPTASIAAASYAATENVPLVLSGTGIAVGDVDAAAGVITATLSVISGTLVAAPGTTGVTVTGGGAAITLSGTLAQVNALLAGTGGSISYLMGSDSPPASDTLALWVNDNGNSGSGGARTAGDTAVIAIAAVNDAPVNTLPGTGMTAEDTPLVFAAGEIAITDVDAGAAGVQVTLGVTSGTLTLGGLAGLAFTVGDGLADSGMVFTGTVSAVNAALAGLVFTPVPDGVLPAVITLSTDDLGNTGLGGALADLNDTITVVVVGTNDPPSASGGTVTTPRNVPYALRVADFGFADPDAGDTLGGVRVDAPPALGTLTLYGAAVAAGQTVAAADIAAGGLVYTPGLDGTGMPYTSFAYTVADAGGLYAAAAATLVIDIANTPPSGADGAALTFEGVAYTLTVADFGFADVDAGDALTAVRIDVPPALGTLTLGGVPVAPGDVIAVADIAAGLLVYMPPAVGTGSPFAGIAFSVRDSYGPDFDPTPAALAIDVVAATSAPVNVVPGLQTVSEDTSTAIAGVAVADVNGDLATVSLAAANGTVTVSLAGGASVSGGTNGGAAVTLFGTQAQLNAALATLVYRGNADFTGADAITLVSSDATLLTAASTIPVMVTAVNDAPTAAIGPASYAADEGVPLALAGTGLAVGDIDSSSVTVTLSVLSGTLSVTGTGVTIAGSGSAVVVLTGAVADVDALLAGGGMVTYLMGSDAPPATDTLRLQIDDGAGGSAFDVATIAIAPVNDAPVNTLPGAVATLEDTAIVFTGATRIAVTDTDAGSAAVQVSLTASQGVLDLSATAGLVFLAGDGAGDAAMTLSGTLAAVNAALDGLRYTPTLHYNGIAFLSILSSDLGANGAGGVRTDSDSTTLSIAPVNDAPDGTDATLLATEDVAYVLSAASFGFVDVDAGDSLAAVRIDAVTLPVGATLRLAGVDVAPGDVVDAADLAAGRLVFTAAADANGAAYASLRFSVRDAGGPAFDPVPNVLVLDVAAVNDAPVITSNGGGAAAAVSTAENATPVLATVTATDVDSAPAGFTYGIAGGADAARFVIDAVTGALRFAAAPNFEAPADAGADNVYDVVVRIADGDGGFDTQAIAVSVTDADDAPVAADDAYAALEDLPLVIAAAGVLGNDLDEDGSTLMATLVSGPASGTVTLNADGSFTYTPDANFVGTDGFRYRVSDGALVSGVATVVISVAPENVAPTAGGGGFAIDAGLAYVFGVGDFGYADQDGDPLASVTITALPAVGELRLAGVAVVVGQQIDAADIAAGRLQYVTPAAAPAVTGFGFVVSDGTATSASAGTITIGITAVPAPAADPGGGGGPSAPPPAEPAPTPPARPGPARGDTALGEAPAGGGRAGGSAGGGEGGDAAPVQAQAQNAPAAPAAATAGVAAPTTTAALSSSGASAGLALAAPREAGLGGVEVRDGSAHEQEAAAARAVQAIAALAAPEFRGELDRLREEQAQEATVTARVAGSVMVVTSGLSVGYVLWLLRGGVLLASLLTSLPAWRLVDPLPVLAHMGGDDEDDDSLQDMVDGGGKPRTEAAAQARTGAPASTERS
jgi:CSLREA domain-containing protein